MSDDSPRLILASASPRRRDLLARAGFRFGIVRPEVAETSAPQLTARELVLANARAKGIAVARTHAQAVVLAADTLVALGAEVIGKPFDLADARRILRRLQGREHLVATGIFLCCPTNRRAELFSVSSRVIFHPLDRSQIDVYLEKIQPLDKAGAYAAQDCGGEIIARIIGSRSNVIGLPLAETIAALARFGLTPNESRGAISRPRKMPVALAAEHAIEKPNDKNIRD